jgi:dolichyl-phosphate-mannose--protein O-mannosyl transferase
VWERAMTQNFENHVKFVPAFHIVVLGIFTINLGWSLYRVAHTFSAESVISLLLAIAFILLAFYARTFALAVQDRLIRLEMRLRMQQVLPAELRPRISEFGVSQLVALRFASDAELPVLAKKVLDEKLNDRKAIKKMIRDWQPDMLRA